MSLSFRPARPADLPGTYALMARLGVFPDAPDPRGVELRLWALWKDTGWSPLNQVLALEGDRVVGSLCFFPTGERGVVLEPPRLAPGAEAVPLVRAALEGLAGRFAYAQALLPAESRDFAAAGLPAVARLLQLERDAGPADAPLAPGSSLAFRHPGGMDLLEALMARTLEGSRDIPAVQEALPPSEMLAAYRPPGHGVPPRWFLAEAGGEPVGCLLLDQRPGGILELKYMGLVPASRGRGLGRELVRRALTEAAGAGLARVQVSVDSANGPALAAYLGQGFRETARKVLHFKTLP